MSSINSLKPLLKAALLINLSNIDNFYSVKISGMLGFEPRTAGSGSNYANHCGMLSPMLVMFTSRSWYPYWKSP